MINIKVLSSSSKGNAYIINDGRTSLLLEAGISWAEIQQKNKFQIINAILISHSHMDHAKGVLTAANMGTEIYISQATKDALNLDRYNYKIITTLKQFSVGTFDILPFDVEHDVEAHGFLMYSRQSREKVCFISDTCFCKHTFSGVTHWLVECNHSREILDRNVENGIIPLSLRQRIVQSHMGLEVLKKFFRANDISKTKEIYLIHLSQNNANPTQFKEEIKKLTGRAVYIA